MPKHVHHRSDYTHQGQGRHEVSAIKKKISVERKTKPTVDQLVAPCTGGLSQCTTAQEQAHDSLSAAHSLQQNHRGLYYHL